LFLGNPFRVEVWRLLLTQGCPRRQPWAELLNPFGVRTSGPLPRRPKLGTTVATCRHEPGDITWGSAGSCRPGRIAPPPGALPSTARRPAAGAFARAAKIPCRRASSAGRPRRRQAVVSVVPARRQKTAPWRGRIPAQSIGSAPEIDDGLSL